ncbi:MAG: glycosyltransferase family 4 protein [Flavobacteriales bacterium]|nr:glycosyltransferase family 4 protein [Flavobacteriales bacterium]
MRIILLTQYFPPEVGAPQNRLFAMAKGLRAKGAEVEVLTAMPNYPDMRIHAGYRGRWSMRQEMEGLRVHRVWLFVSKGRGLVARLMNYFSFVFTALAYGLFKLRKADVLLVESPPLFLGITAMWLARAKGAKLVFNVSDLWPESAVQLGLVTNRFAIGLSERLEMRCYRRSALITGQTMGIVDNIRSRCPDRTVLWIPNGVDIDLIERVGDGAGARARHGVPATAFVLAYTGIIGHAQGLEVVLNAAERLADRPEVLFLLVGDGPERAGLREMAAANGLANVRFIDPMPRGEVLALVAACDGVVVPLRRNKLFEGAIPSKIFEALALGRPLLLGVEGEARRLFVEEGQAGLAFAPEDAGALEQAVRQYLDEPALRTAHGANGARYVRERFDRRMITERLWNGLQDLFGAQRPGDR